jgi:hypothetical protein
MKSLLFILCLFFSSLINAQTINFKNFDNKALNNAISDTLKPYRNYFYDTHIFNQNRIYNFIKKNHDKLSIDKLCAKINNRILKISDELQSISIVGIMDSVQCKNLKTYQDIASKCNSDWNNPSDAFFRSIWGEKIMPVNYYDKETNICYIFVCLE